MLSAIPLLIVPFILYNLGLMLPPGGTAIWSDELFSLQMMSGGLWTMTMGDALIVLTLVFLFVEIVKSTRTSNASIRSIRSPRSVASRKARVTPRAISR